MILCNKFCPKFNPLWPQAERFVRPNYLSARPPSSCFTTCHNYVDLNLIQNMSVGRSLSGDLWWGPVPAHGVAWRARDLSSDFGTSNLECGVCVLRNEKIGHGAEAAGACSDGPRGKRSILGTQLRLQHEQLFCLFLDQIWLICRKFIITAESVYFSLNLSKFLCFCNKNISWQVLERIISIYK